MRVAVTSVSPALVDIQSALGISPGVAGLTLTIPLLCNGLLGLITPLLMNRLSHTAAAFMVITLLTVGVGLRSIPVTIILLCSVAIIGTGTAIGNVVMPVFIRFQKPRELSKYMAYYTLMVNLGATAGAVATGMFIGTFGWAWQLALLAWLPFFVGTIAWCYFAARARQVTIEVDNEAEVGRPTAAGEAEPAVAASAGAGAGAEQEETQTKAQMLANYKQLLREKRAYLTVTYTGLHFIVFYAFLSWFPAQMQDTGMNVAQASFWLSVFTGMAMPAGFITPRLMDAKHGMTIILVISLLCAPLISFAHLGGIIAIAAAIIGGIWQGMTFSVSLVIIARTPDPNLVAPLSAFAQGGAYLMGAIAPSGFGFLQSLTGSWVVPNFIMGASILIMCVIQLGIARMEKAIPAPTHTEYLEHD